MTEKRRRFKPANLSEEEARIFTETQGAIARGDVEAIDELLKPGSELIVDTYMEHIRELQGDPEVTTSKSPVPDDIDDYAGMWVALRGGKVAAVAESSEELFKSTEVEPGDAFYRVPEQGPKFYEV